MNIREVVKRRIRQNHGTLTEVSRELGYTHVNGLKYQLDQDQPNWAIITKIGQIINHDFTRDFPNMPVTQVSEPAELYATKSMTLTECMMQVNYLRKRILDLLRATNICVNAVTAGIEGVR